MPTNVLYDTVLGKLRQLRPGERITRMRNLAWLMTGVFLSKSVHLNKIAMKMPAQAVQMSIVKRLHRFLANPSFHVRSWYEPIARELLEQMGNTVGEIRLLMDTTKIGTRHQWLTVSVAFRRRAIPVGWTWLPSAKGHSSATLQLALLRYVYTLVAPNRPVLLVADTEFEDGDLQKQLNEWHWAYVLRQKPNNRVQVDGEWRSFRSLVSSPGTSVWTAKAVLTLKHKLTANLLAYWQPGQENPWLLATNLPSSRAALQAYQRRMWIEEMHGDLKAHGFYLADSHLNSSSRLSRLAFAVVLLYLWIVLNGASIIKNGLRRLVDRNDRRDLSLFQIGLRFIERSMASSCSIRLPALKVSGG